MNSASCTVAEKTWATVAISGEQLWKHSQPPLWWISREHEVYSWHRFFKKLSYQGLIYYTSNNINQATNWKPFTDTPIVSALWQALISNWCYVIQTKSNFLTGLHQREDFPYQTQLFICHFHSWMCVGLNNFMVQIFNVAFGNIQQYIFYKVT
jgi:hypothetical protein